MAWVCSRMTSSRSDFNSNLCLSLECRKARWRVIEYSHELNRFRSSSCGKALKASKRASWTTSSAAPLLPTICSATVSMAGLNRIASSSNACRLPINDATTSSTSLNCFHCSGFMAGFSLFGYIDTLPAKRIVKIIPLRIEAFHQQ